MGGGSASLGSDWSVPMPYCLLNIFIVNSVSIYSLFSNGSGTTDGKMQSAWIVSTKTMDGEEGGN